MGRLTVLGGSFSEKIRPFFMCCTYDNFCFCLVSSVFPPPDHEMRRYDAPLRNGTDFSTQAKTQTATGGQTKLADRGSPVMFIGCEWT